MTDEIVRVVREGGVGVIPTDTIYGIVGSALKKNTVERIYRLRKRNKKKPMIVLISAMRDLARFGVRPNAAQKRFLNRVWPGKASVILPCPSKKFAYLHRGTRSLAFRMPAPQWLAQLLKKTGPLVAPSANFEGHPPARTVNEARRYFGERIDFYYERGRLGGAPSRLYDVREGNPVRLR